LAPQIKKFLALWITDYLCGVNRVCKEAGKRYVGMVCAVLLPLRIFKDDPVTFL
jgi:hypothetical protein